MKRSFRVLSLIIAAMVALSLFACAPEYSDGSPDSSFSALISDSIAIVDSESEASFSETSEQTDGELSEEDPITYSVTPALGETVDFHTERQRAFFDGIKSGAAVATNDFLVSDYARGVEELSRPEPIELCWSGEDGVIDYYLEISLTEDFSNSSLYLVHGKTLKLYNLFSGARYFWRVAPSQGQLKNSSVYNFNTAEGVRNVFVDGITNVRDLGGYTTVDGAKVRQGLLYRGGMWNAAWTDTLSLNFKATGLTTVLRDLALKSEIDLRGQGDSERGNMNDSAIPGIRYYYYGCSYSSGIFPANNDTVKRIFEEILSVESNYPVYFHCAIGTDRTGMLAYVIGGVLGISENDLQVDYLLSNFGNIGSSRSLTSDMNNFRQVIAAKSGETHKEKVEKFLIEDVGVSASAIEKLRGILLEY